MFLFPNDQIKKDEGKTQQIPQTSQVSEEADRITARELDEFFRKGKEIAKPQVEKKEE